MNVRIDQVVVSGEGEAVCVVLIPRRQLGGLALIVWSDLRGVQLCWSYVTTLRRHDKIDLAVRVTVLSAEPDVDAIAEALFAEMARPIEVQIRARRLRKPNVECSLEIDGGRRVIGRIPFGGSADVTGVLTTSLAQGSLPFEVPVAIVELRRTA